MSTAVIDFEADDFVDHINPPHQVKDHAKLQMLIDNMDENGWIGRPILAYQDASGGIYALTGSHRIAAARELEIEIPVMYVDASVGDFENDAGEFLMDVIATGDDRVATFLRDAGDDNSADLMDAETML